ncbi:cobalamin-dependent protein [Paenibacillus sp.]|uniref:cobalamin-dependent protein n=1 Tax=Paenibacillus sp. TaxID=58172 RepID=UPI002D29C52A|nr:cobalamin-dependent protein [Paenibacillus sp.]HZG56973.1 cobalamin-dependent protein [Paenibacillus sp.]
MTTIRKPVVLIAKVGLDGHDRGALVVARALREDGFDVRYSGLRRTPEEIAALAVACRADCVGLSSLAGAHLSLFPRVSAALAQAGWRGALVAGGIIPAADEAALRAAGFLAVFGPHRPASEAAAFLREALAAPARGAFGGNEVG